MKEKTINFVHYTYFLYCNMLNKAFVMFLHHTA